MSSFWRVIEATATMSGTTRAYRVILKPQLWPNNIQSAWQTPTSTSSFNPLNKYSAFGYSQMILARNTTTDGYMGGNPSSYASTKMTSTNGGQSGALGGDVSSYGNISMSGTGSRPAVVGGSVDVPQANGASTIAAQTTNSSANQVNRYVTVNGQVSGLNDGSLGGNTNVFGMTSSALPSTGQPALQYNQSTAQNPVVPAPSPTPYFSDSSTSTAIQTLGDLNLTNVTINVTNTASPPPPGGYVMPSSGTLNIQPGNYMVGSIATSGSGAITISSNVTSSQPVRFFVSDNTTSETALSISGSGISNFSAAPSNLQIYYNGDRPMSITQSNSFSGVVYAPNADLSIGSRSSGKVDYYGSFVGDTTSITYANIHYDRSGLLNGGGSSGYSAQLNKAYNLIPSSQRPQTPFWYFNVASWQEWSPLYSLPANQ
jgi:hypothetical protein